MRELLYIGGALAAGWMIGKIVLGGRAPSRNASGEHLVPVERISVDKPEFARRYDVWSTEVTGRLAIQRDRDIIGYIQGWGSSYNAYAFVRDEKITVGLDVTKKNAIGVVVAADLIVRLLKKRQIRSTITVQSSRYSEISETMAAWRPELVAAQDISQATGVGLKTVEKVGKKLAEKKIIFGMAGRVTVPAVVISDELLIPTQEQEQRARSRRRRGRKVSIEQRRRRIIGVKADVEKLRKSLVLSKEEKKSLPRASTMTRYSFALYGPEGSVGMFEYSNKKALQMIQGEWSEAERARLEKRLEERELQEREEKELQLQISRERAARESRKKRHSEISQEDAIKQMVSRSGEYEGDFFEQRRLAGLDFVSRRRQDRARIVSKVDRARRRVEQLEREMSDARKRFFEAKQAGHAGRAMQAAATMTKKESQLADAQAVLAEVNDEFERFQKLR